MTTWIWDASALHHAARADRLDVLLDLAKGAPDPPARLLTTTLVQAELVGNGCWQPCVSRIGVVDLATMEEMLALARWLDIVSHGLHSRGEATVFAWAEINGGVVIIDDGDARRAARRHGLTVHGTMWIIAMGMRAGCITPYGADQLVEHLRRAGAYLPSLGVDGVAGWARRQGISG